jgi:nucleotide-binding universal stress UspA family protein
VTVMTVIEVPRTFLQTMDEEERRSFLDDRSWETDTAQMMALGYLEERGRRVVEPIVAALRATGRVPAVAFVEGDDPAEAIVSQARASGADLIVMGATRRPRRGG